MRQIGLEFIVTILNLIIMNSSTHKVRIQQDEAVYKVGSANQQAQQGLKRLKNDLNLSDETMANALGVPLPQMVVMLYGPPSKIAAKIADKIKVLETVRQAQSNVSGKAVMSDADIAALPVSPTLRADQQELLDLQKEMGLTHDDLARIAGIPRPRMMTYVYGRTRRIPESVLIAIRNERNTQAVSDPFGKEAVQELDGGLSNFVARWQTRLGIAPDDLLTTGKAMGVSKSTLLRWMNGTASTRPSFIRASLAALHAYEQELKNAKSSD